MRDNALIIFVRAALLELLPGRGLGNVAVRQNWQPRQQGRANETCIYLHKITDRRYGSRAVREVWDTDTGEMVRRETQLIETTLQFTVLAAERDPASDEDTAADVARAASAVLQSPAFIERAGKAGVQVLRIQDIRNQPVENDRDRFEFETSFDAIFAHEDTHTENIYPLTGWRSGIHGI
ncbi:MAG: hypothetical protein LBP58_06900 [Azoarcus sp.]|jgi:hypothetical protein|nr:hypothetical protein [Azoarcus sp.]